MHVHFGILQLELVPFIQRKTPHCMMWGMRFATATRAIITDYIAPPRSALAAISPCVRLSPALRLLIALMMPL